MNLTEFRDKINKLYEATPYPDEITVAIPVVRLNAIGPRASVTVEHVYQGFDWDSNTLFIQPDGDELREINRDEISALCEAYNIVVSEAMKKRKK